MLTCHTVKSASQVDMWRCADDSVAQALKRRFWCIICGSLSVNIYIIYIYIYIYIYSVYIYIYIYIYYKDNVLYYISQAGAAINVTGFAKTVPKNWNPISSLVWKLDSSTTQIHHSQGYGWPDLLLQAVFCRPCKTMTVHYRVYGATEGH